MKLCYQAATPDVAIADSVTAYQGSLAKTFGDLGALGYDGVELMTLNPGKLDWREVKETAEENNLSVVLVCTGEIFGQLGLSYTHPPPVPTPGGCGEDKGNTLILPVTWGPMSI